jgi:hypothetical protein
MAPRFCFFDTGNFLAFLVLCCGGDFATMSTARSKRCHASGCNSTSLDLPGTFAMPRQPLMYMRSQAQFRFPANALAERPELAALIGECIAVWSSVEAQLAIMLSAIMKTQTGITAAVFLSIRNSRAQREALNAAAQVGLSGRELEMFSAISFVYQSIDSQRTDLAHGIFALTEDIPDVTTHPSAAV